MLSQDGIQAAFKVKWCKVDTMTLDSCLDYFLSFHKIPLTSHFHNYSSVFFSFCCLIEHKNQTRNFFIKTKKKHNGGGKAVEKES